MNLPRFRSKLRLVGLFTLTIAGCTSLEGAVESYKNETGLSFELCGRIEASCVSSPSAPSTPAACMAEHFKTCQPAQLDLLNSTIEGDPIPETILVFPGEGGCNVIRFTDTRQDNYGPHHIYRYTCDRLELSAFCPGIVTPGC